VTGWSCASPRATCVSTLVGWRYTSATEFLKWQSTGSSIALNSPTGLDWRCLRIRNEELSTTLLLLSVCRQLTRVSSSTALSSATSRSIKRADLKQTSAAMKKQQIATTYELILVTLNYLKSASLGLMLLREIARPIEERRCTSMDALGRPKLSFPFAFLCSLCRPLKRKKNSRHLKHV
jgi:hypothetical protein